MNTIKNKGYKEEEDVVVGSEHGRRGNRRTHVDNPADIFINYSQDRRFTLTTLTVEGRAKQLHNRTAN